MDNTKREEAWEMSASRPGDVTYDLDGVAKFQRSEQALSFVKLIPEEFTVKVPCEWIKYISGDLGQDVRTRAVECGVTIEITDALTKSDSVVLRGPPSKCADIKMALLLLVEQLAAKQEDEKRKRFCCDAIRVKFRHFPALLGREGKGIGKYRRKYGVHIILPARAETTQEREIAIVGSQDRVKAAKEDMLAFLKQLDTQSFLDVNIDRRVHSRILGAKGRHADEIRKHYKVRIYFPKEGEPDVVKLTGLKENVEKAKRYLLYLEDFYIEIYAAESKGQHHNRNDPEDYVAGKERQSATHSRTNANYADEATSSSILSRKRPSWGPPI